MMEEEARELKKAFAELHQAFQSLQHEYADLKRAYVQYYTLTFEVCVLLGVGSTLI